MKIEKSAGAVIFRREGKSELFLLLRYPAVAHRSKSDYWDYVKGHLENNEDDLETIKREAIEETGINDLKFLDGFSETMEYFFKYEGELISKSVNFRLAQTKTNAVTLSDEHTEYAWLPFQEAYNALSFDNARQILKKANDFLAKRP